MSLSQGDAFLSCPGSVDLGVLLPHLAGVIVEAVTAAAGLLLVTARARAPEAACPECGTVSGRVHSRYCRTLADAAIGGRPVAIALAVRRFFCAAPGCPRKTFAEQVDGLTTRYARKTPLLAGMLGRIAVALAGRAGSRLAAGLGVPASRQVLLRLVMATRTRRRPGPGCSGSTTSRSGAASTTARCSSTSRPAPRWTCSKAATPGPWPSWLAAHPGVEVICRDRPAPTRTEPGPGHRMRSRSPTGSTCGRTSPRPSRSASPPTAPAWPGPAPAAAEVSAAGTAPADAAPEPRGSSPSARSGNHALVHQLRAEGRGIREIARHLGWGQHTVQRYDRAATWQELVDGRWTAPRPSKLDPFKPYLDQRADGSHGSFRACSTRSRTWATTAATPSSATTSPGGAPPGQPLPPAPPTVRDVTNWLTRRPDTLTEDEKPLLKAILDRCPKLQAASGQVRAFAAMITGLSGENLPQWMAAAREGPARHRVVRQGPGTGPRRRHQRPDHELELRPRRRPRQPHQDDVGSPGRFRPRLSQNRT